MAEPPAIQTMVERLRGTDQRRDVGEALLDQSLVAGIGNKWKAEALFEAGLSPWKALATLSDAELNSVLDAAARLMRGPRGRRQVYRRVGRPCPRCGARLRSRAQGDQACIAYWCPACQAGTGAPGS